MTRLLSLTHRLVMFLPRYALAEEYTMFTHKTWSAWHTSSSAQSLDHHYRSSTGYPLNLCLLPDVADNRRSEWIRTQPRVFNQIYFRLVFKSWPSPGLKENQLLVDHTSVYQVIFLTEQPIGASSLSSYPGQTSCLPVSGTFLWEVTKPLNRKHDAESRGKRLAKSLCGSPTITAFSLTWKIPLPQLPPVYTCQVQCCIQILLHSMNKYWQSIQ
jgi:hypothetical protein